MPGQVQGVPEAVPGVGRRQQGSVGRGVLYGIPPGSCSLCSLTFTVITDSCFSSLLRAEEDHLGFKREIYLNLICHFSVIPDRNL